MHALTGGVPTLADLERHYRDMGEQKRRMEEVLERTERMMAGLKRGIEEMRGGGMVEMRGGNGEAVPLPGPRGEKRDREKTPVWAVSGAPPSQSDK